MKRVRQRWVKTLVCQNNMLVNHFSQVAILKPSLVQILSERGRERAVWGGGSGQGVWEGDQWSACQ